MSPAPGTIPPIDHGLFLFQLSRARRHLREGKYDLAREELEPARILRPKDEDVLNLLSVVEFKRGRLDEAARAARALVKENPSSAILHANLGLILFKSGVLDEAERELRQALDLAPGHPRSHMYLGLLYRMKGKLGLAVEHLRFAGAKRLVAEIEEGLRRSMRELASQPLASESTAPLPAELFELTPSAFFLASSDPSAPPAPMATFPPSELSPDSRETAPRPEAVASAAVPATEARPLFKILPDGGLEISSRGCVFVRKGSVVWYSGKIRFAPEPAFRGTRLERILRAQGRGNLYVSDIGRRAFQRDLKEGALYLEGSRLLALDEGLSFRLEPIHDFRNNRRVDILKLHGSGSVVLSVGGEHLVHEVSAEFPLIVSSRDLVAWSGSLVPSVVEDRFLEEVMQPDAGSAPKIRFEGEGTVLTEPPRPRRRATDLQRAPEDRRGG